MCYFNVFSVYQSVSGLQTGSGLIAGLRVGRGVREGYSGQLLRREECSNPCQFVSLLAPEDTSHSKVVVTLLSRASTVILLLRSTEYII